MKYKDIRECIGAEKLDSATEIIDSPKCKKEQATTSTYLREGKVEIEIYYKLFNFK